MAKIQVFDIASTGVVWHLGRAVVQNGTFDYKVYISIGQLDLEGAQS